MKMKKTTKKKLTAEQIFEKFIPFDGSSTTPIDNALRAIKFALKQGKK